jgi:hypothetical protein
MSFMHAESRPKKNHIILKRVTVWGDQNEVGEGNKRVGGVSMVEVKCIYI